MVLNLQSFAVLFAILASSCGGGNTEVPVGTTASADSQSALVRIPQGASALGPGAFGANPLNVTAGAFVIWINDDDLKHTVTSNDGLFNSGALSPGQIFGTKFNSPGSYNYHDDFEPGLSGSITVR